MNGNVPVIFPVIPIRDNWQTQAHEIALVTNAEQPVVTTTSDHGYSDGLMVKIFVPKEYGMDIDRVTSSITVLSNTQFQVNIDTTNLSPFVEPTFLSSFTPAQVVQFDGPFENIAPD